MTKQKDKDEKHTYISKEILKDYQQIYIRTEERTNI